MYKQTKLLLYNNSEQGEFLQKLPKTLEHLNPKLDFKKDICTLFDVESRSEVIVFFILNLISIDL